MIFVEFPIVGTYRLPLLIIEWIVAFICLEIALVFLMRFIRSRKKEVHNFQEFGYFALLLGFSLMWLFFVLGDYYVSEEIVSPFYIWNTGSERMVILNLGYFSLMFCAFLFILLMEKYKIYLFKKYLFSIIFLILIVIFIISFFVDIGITQQLSMVFWPLFFFFFIIYTMDFGKIIRSSSEYTLLKLLEFFTGFVLLALGFVFTTDFVTSRFGLGFRLIGDIIQLVGILLISHFFLTIPAFAEFDWQESVEDVYLIDKSGICLLYKSFDPETELADENLISGAIASVNLMLQELTKSEGISVLSKKDKTIIIYPSKFISGVVFSKRELINIKINIKRFVKKFEAIYQTILPDWDGDINIFKPTEHLAEEIFAK